MLDALLDSFGYTQHVLCGRGTTAIWLAVRAMIAGHESAEVIMSDVLCSTALDGVLLAGAIPRFAAVSAARFTVTPESIAAAITPHTRAILVAHTFGHGVDIDAIRAVAPNIPIIEDAVQGVGGHVHGQMIGTLGDMSLLSFHPTKLIDGHGGALMFNDAVLRAKVTADATMLLDNPQVEWERVRTNLHTLLPSAAADGYLSQLQATYRTLLKPFDAHDSNLDQIIVSFCTLSSRIAARNITARKIRDSLYGLAVTQPEVHDGDAIWRYTIMLPSAIAARQVVHALARAKVLCTQLYPALSGLLGQPIITPFADRFVNFWVDETADQAYAERVRAVLKDLKSLTIDKKSQIG
jgi:dTDP-4-amino-4,6-dideoxygalactose transaminase